MAQSSSTAPTPLDDTPKPPTPSPSSTDAIEPSVPLYFLGSLVCENAPLGPLVKEKNNWSEWSFEVEARLAMNGGADRYLDPTFIPPNKELEPRAYHNWIINDNAVLAYLRLSVSEQDREIVAVKRTETMKASRFYAALKAKYTSPLAQALLLQEAFTIGNEKDPLTPVETIAKVEELNERMWKMGKVDKTVSRCALMINALEDFPHTLDKISHELAKEKTPEDLLGALNSIVQQLDVKVHSMY